MKDVSLIILYDDKKRILIQDRDKHAPTYPNYWSFFGGQIEKGESPVNGAKREAFEELEVELKNPKLFHEEFVELQGVKMHCYYFIEKISDKGAIILHEGKGMGWFNTKEIRNMVVTPLVRNIVERIEKELT